MLFTLGISIALVIHSLDLTPECIDEGRPFLYVIPQDLLSRSLFSRLILRSGESRPGKDLYGNSIAVASHSLDHSLAARSISYICL